MHPKNNDNISIPYKDWVGRSLLNKRVRFVCDCVMALDVRGIVVGYEVSRGEIIYIVRKDDDKIIRIGENTPKLSISIS